MAEEKAYLVPDPPYMETRTRADAAHDGSIKENIPPYKRPSAQRLHTDSGKEESFGLSLLLGDEYERKKQGLQEELRLDYKRYMAQEISRERKKKKAQNADSPGPQGLSLPIGDRRSAKDRLRNERNNEYNQYLKGQGSQMKVEQHQTNAVQVQDREVEYTADVPQVQASQRVPKSREWLSRRRDAATLNEAGTHGRHRLWEGGGRPRRLRVEYDSELDHSELDDMEEELNLLVDRGGPEPRHKPTYTHRRGRRLYYRPDRVRERRDFEVPVIYDEDRREEKRKTTPRPKLQTPEEGRSSRMSASKRDKAEFATGLLIGVAEGDVAVQRRKDMYRLELLEQMAEKQRNRKREKDLELRVAATGAIDPEKQPDRIKQFGAVSRYESNVPPRQGFTALWGDLERKPRGAKSQSDSWERVPPERPCVAFQSPLLDPDATLAVVTSTGAPGPGARVGLAGGSEATPFNQHFHANLSSTLGEIMGSRVLAAPPPPSLPALADAYRTPYDEAYYFHGVKNPLDPTLAYSGPAGGGAHPVVYYNLPPGAPELSQPSHPEPRAQARGQMGAPPGGTFPVERPKPTKESAWAYQEALKQQIQERETRKIQDKVERERYDAKLEAEMRAYDPWGKGGCGAPLKDDQGNLITDLNQMHKSNEEAYVNPGSRNRRGAAEVVDKNVQIPRGEGWEISGSHTSPFARGNVFPDLPKAQQLIEQVKYSDCLRQQIEEKRQKEAEERERLRLEEEKEERRLAKQRAQILKEYEEELGRKKCKEVELQIKNEELMRQAEERRKEAERKKREVEEHEKEALRKQYEGERQYLQQEVQRQPSPPIPALQKKLYTQQKPRPPSSNGRLSTPALSERSLSTPQSPPVPARRNKLRAAEGIISGLSDMHRQLRSEQRLEGQLQQAEREGPETPLNVRLRDPPRVGVFDMARQRLSAPVRRPSSKVSQPVNIQNIRDFNQLKYRDSESREEVRQVYPDPPDDDNSLDIQQQALLREQKRRLNWMRKKEPVDHFDTQPLVLDSHHARKISQDPPRDSLLQSESVFFEPVRDGWGELPELALRVKRPSARERRPAKSRGRDNADILETGTPGEPAGQSETRSLLSESSMDTDRGRVRRREDTSQRDWPTGVSPDDEGYEPPPPWASRQTSGRRSVDTLATEPWLRPGTSETVKRFMEGRGQRLRPSSRSQALHNWDGTPNGLN